MCSPTRAPPPSSRFEGFGHGHDVVAHMDEVLANRETYDDASSMQ